MFGCNSIILYFKYFLLIYCNFSYWSVVLVPLCVLVYIYVYQRVVTCFPVAERHLIVNI